MKNILKSLVFLVVALLLTNISIAQKKTTTAEFLEEVSFEDAGIHKTFEEMLASAEIKTLNPDKETKGIVNEKSPIMLIEGEKAFPAPYTIYRIDVQDEITVDLRALGNMGGFKKVIMFPITFLYKENGERVNSTQIKAYYLEAAGMKYPVNIHSTRSFIVDEPGTYYIVIAADNSSSTDVGYYSSEGYENATFVSKKGKGILDKYPVGRSTYGRLKFTVK